MSSTTPSDGRGGLRVVRDKPSLFDGRHAAEDDREGPVSILSAMESAPRPRRQRAARHRRGVQHWLLWLLLGLGLVLTAWSVARYASAAPAPDPIHRLLAGASPERKPLASAGVPPPVLPASAPARIEDTVVARTAIDATPAQAADVNPASTAAVSADKPADKPVLAAHRKSADQNKERLVAAKPVKASGALRRDADVDLMVALLDHMNGRGSPHAPAAMQTASDVDDRVRACRQLGGQEATDCKLRVCRGWWGKRAACPAASD